jgi:hypothetical protein
VSAQAPAGVGGLHGDQARDHGADEVAVLDGRPIDIACGQIDIGNALTEMAQAMTVGRAAGGRVGALSRPRGPDDEARTGAAHGVAALSANIPSTVMAPRCPWWGGMSDVGF